jgi:PAS domain S-box-containing protein
VGRNTLSIAWNEHFDFGTAFRQAANRTIQRRNFSKINKVPAMAHSIASSSVRVENFGIFLEQAPIGALLVDEESHVVAINQKAKQIFSTEENKPYVLKDLLPAVSLQQLKRSVHAGTETVSKVIQSGSRFLELHLSLVKNEEGKALNILLLNDITEQKIKETALVESEALFRFLAEAMPQKLWTADETGARNFFNKKWLEYSGMSLAELQGWGWVKLVHPDDIEKNIETWKHSVATGNDFQFEHRIQRHDGQYRWHLVRGVARKNRNGKVLMWIGTNTDIHEQKAFAEELERRVKERTLELENTNNELEQFVYVTSHDLQEPLRKIRIFSDILRQSGNQLDATARKHIEKINATALRMSTLMKELLNFTHMNKEEQFVPTDLNEIIAKVLLDCELIIQQKGATLQIDKLPVIDAVPVQMHQLFYNLVNNALKFTRPDTPPVISITLQSAKKESRELKLGLHPDKQYYEIIVQDNGIGFDQSHDEQIFHIFQRLHSRSEFSGTGIGLALCKKVATNHHGAIYAVSEKDKGAAFHILLPGNQ